MHYVELMRKWDDHLHLFHAVTLICSLRGNDLFQLPHKGSKFTWCNGRGGSAWVESLLDMVLVSTQFLQAWQAVSSVALARHNSDHAPLLLSCASDLCPPPTRFRFQTMWLFHLNMREFIVANWNEPADCLPLFQLVTAKLKRL